MYCKYYYQTVRIEDDSCSDTVDLYCTFTGMFLMNKRRRTTTLRGTVQYLHYEYCTCTVPVLIPQSIVVIVQSLLISTHRYSSTSRD